MTEGARSSFRTTTINDETATSRIFDPPIENYRLHNRWSPRTNISISSLLKNNPTPKQSQFQIKRVDKIGTVEGSVAMTNPHGD